VAEVAAQAIEFPDHQRVRRAEGFETRGEARPGVMAARGQILIEPVRGDPCHDEGIALEIQDLGAIGLRDPHVPEEHTSPSLVIYRM
jgi:hypothetical protein